MNIFLADLVHTTASQKVNVNRVDSRGKTVPLGIASIAAYAKKTLGNLIDVSLFKYPNDLLTGRYEEPDVIAFSNYIWNTHLTYKIGGWLRNQFPNALIVAGGPSIRTDRGGIEAYLKANPFLDVYILYDGERSFLDILQAYKRHGRSLMERDHSIEGACYLSPDGLVFNENRPSCDLAEMPSPYLEGYLDKFLESGFIPLFESNRGCPFGCTYCAWGVSARNKVRKRPIEIVFAEMDYVAEKFPNMPRWIIADANFGILKRDVEIAY